MPLEPGCFLNSPPFFQCCCICEHHKKDYHHCDVSEDLKKETGKCVCNVQKGYICQPPNSDMSFSGWPKHSVGCEMFSAELSYKNT
jgi:hypothetical protein